MIRLVELTIRQPDCVEFHSQTQMASINASTTETVALVPIDAVQNSSHDALRRLITLITRFSSQADFKLVAGYFDENERLLSELETTKTELKEQSNVNLRHAKDISSLRETAEDNANTIHQLKTEVNELKKTVQEFNQSTEKQKKRLTKAAEMLKTHDILQKAKDEEINQLEEKLRNERQKSSELRTELNSLKDSKSAIEAKHDVVASKLAEIENFTIQLHQDQPDLM